MGYSLLLRGLGLTNTGGSYAAALILVLGVFLGSAAWWLLLSGGVGFVREKFNSRELLRVNRISGVIALGSLLGGSVPQFLRRL